MRGSADMRGSAGIENISMEGGLGGEDVIGRGVTLSVDNVVPGIEGIDLKAGMRHGVGAEHDCVEHVRERVSGGVEVEGREGGSYS
jgi:hypothetical protein